MTKVTMKLRCIIGACFGLLMVFASVCSGQSLGQGTASDTPFFELVDVHVSGQNGYHTYRIPAIVVSKQGTVLGFCEGRKSSPSDAGDIDLLLRRSFDGGKSWAKTQLVHEEGGTKPITIGNPCPIADRDGTIHLVFCRNNKRAFYTKSTDDGATFHKSVEITGAFHGFDFAWTRLATGPSHGIQMRSGRIIVPVWINDRIGHYYRSAVIYSDDAGKTWAAGGIVKPAIRDCSECMAVELADGSLLLNMRNKSAKCRAVTRSTDGGKTWSDPKLIEDLVDPECQAAIIRFDCNGSGRKSGILFSNAASLSRDQMTVKLSSDGGKTWPVAKLIYPGPAAYSDLAVTGDKTILCFFERGSKRYYEKLTLARFNLKWLMSRETK